MPAACLLGVEAGGRLETGAYCAPMENMSEAITKKIAALGDWRGQTLARMRALIHEADPDVVEEIKWMGTPVWSHDGILCTGETYKKVVKLTFAKGASLKDPKRLFNSSLEGNTRRAIDIAEGEQVDAKAFVALVREAVALNGMNRAARSSGRGTAKKAAGTKAPAKKAAPKKAPAKKAAGTKAAVKKAATKKAPAKKAPAKRASAKK